MKQIKTWLTTIAVLLCSGTVSAYDFEVDGIYYNVNQDDSSPTVSVTYLTNTGYENGVDTYSGDVAIPSTVSYENTIYTVTKIGSHAFAYDDITSILLPNTIVAIGSYAFVECPLIRFVVIPERVTSIGRNAFKWCSELREVFLTSKEAPALIYDNLNYPFEKNHVTRKIYVVNTEQTLSIDGWRTLITAVIFLL